MKKFKKILIILVAIPAIIMLFNYTYTFAKYVYTSAWDYYLKSKDFYISSDDLGENTVSNVNKLWNGEDIYFNVKNSKGVNITEYDIEFKVECTIKGEVSSYTKCSLNESNKSSDTGVLSAYQFCLNNIDEIDVSNFNKQECELGGYTWKKEAALKDMYFNIISTDENKPISDITVNITVTSTSPYKKILSADYILHKDSGVTANVSLDYKDMEEYGSLNVTNSYPTNKTVTLKWDSSKLLVDEDKSRFKSFETDENEYINEIEINVDKLSSINLIFYKRDFNEEYDSSLFSVTND